MRIQEPEFPAISREFYRSISSGTVMVRAKEWS